MKATSLIIAALVLVVSSSAWAGHEMKWSDVPEAVRTTVLANGGMAGQTVDRENGKIGGQTVYEAGVKGKDAALPTSSSPRTANWLKPNMTMLPIARWSRRRLRKVNLFLLPP